MSPYKKGVVNTPTEQNYPGYQGNSGWGMAKGGGKMKMSGGMKKAHSGGSMKGRRHNSMSGGYR